MLVNRVSRCDLLFYMVRVDLVIPNSRDFEKTIPGIREWSFLGKSRDSGFGNSRDSGSTCRPTGFMSRSRLLEWRNVKTEIG